MFYADLSTVFDWRARQRIGTINTPGREPRWQFSSRVFRVTWLLTGGAEIVIDDNGCNKRDEAQVFFAVRGLIELFELISELTRHTVQATTSPLIWIYRRRESAFFLRSVAGRFSDPSGEGGSIRRKPRRLVPHAIVDAAEVRPTSLVLSVHERRRTEAGF
jgi:hypothetical protein